MVDVEKLGEAGASKSTGVDITLYLKLGSAKHAPLARLTECLTLRQSAVHLESTK